MKMKRVNLLADFPFHAEGDCERIFSAGDHFVPLAVAEAAKAEGKLGKLPPTPRAPKAAAKPKA